MKKLIAVLSVVLSALFANVAAVAATSPQDLVVDTTNTMLGLLKSERDRLAKDPTFLRKQVDELVLPHMDFNAMTKLAVGSNWRSASEAQRGELETQFRELLVSTYSNSLSEFADNKIDFLPYRPSSRDDRAEVRCEVQLSGAAPVQMVYRLRKLEEAWKIYDITIDGISLVTNYRSSFTSEVSRNGIDGLIKVLKEKNQSLADKRTAAADAAQQGAN